MKLKRWTEVGTCFSFNKTHNTRILAFFEMFITQILHTKNSPHFLKTSLAKIKADVQKSLKEGSVKADFLHGEKINYAEKTSSQKLGRHALHQVRSV